MPLFFTVGRCEGIECGGRGGSGLGWVPTSGNCRDAQLLCFKHSCCPWLVSLAKLTEMHPEEAMSVPWTPAWERWARGFWSYLCHNLPDVARRRQWHPTPVLLPGKSHGRRSLVGCSPWGREESDTTERLHFHFLLSCIGEGNCNPL